MPHFWKDILVVTDEELIPDFYSSKQYLSVKLNRDAKTGEGLRKARNGGGGHPRLIEFDSLPKFIQEAIGDPRAKGHILENYYKRLSDAYNYYSNADGEGFTYPDGSHLLPETIEQLTSNASVMVALQKLKEAREVERKNKGASIRGVLRTVHGDAMSFQKIMQEAGEQPHNLPSTYRYFQQAWQQFNEVGYVALIKDAKGKAKRNALKCDEAHEQLLNDLFATQSNKPSLTKIAFQYEAFRNGDLDIINEITGEFYNKEDFQPLSLSTIKMQLTKWESTIGTHSKRNGNRQVLINQYVPYHSFKRPELAGSIISIDDRQPPFEYEKGKRMWFYLGTDLASGAITVAVWGKSKEGIIMEFYRELVRSYYMRGWRLPYELECESSLNSSFRETFLKPGSMFEEVRIIANNAREKRIERDFGDLRNIIEKEDEAWIARPFARAERNQASPKEKQYVPYQELVKRRLRDIATVNNMPHPVHKNISRWDYCCQNQNPNLKPINWKGILPVLGYSRQSSAKTGIVKFNNSEWIIGDNGKMCTGEQLINKMKLIEGKTIDIRFLDDRDGEVIKAMVFDNGRYLCELIEKPKVNKAAAERTDEELEIMAGYSAYVNTITAYQKLRKNAIDQVGIIDRTKKTISDSFTLEEFGMPADEKQVMPDKLGEVIEENEEELVPVTVNRSWDDKFKI